jgi:hypothetical protein
MPSGATTDHLRDDHEKLDYRMVLAENDGDCWHASRRTQEPILRLNDLGDEERTKGPGLETRQGTGAVLSEG